MSGDLDREPLFPRRRRRRPAQLSVVLKTLIAVADQRHANPLLISDAQAWLKWAESSETPAPDPRAALDREAPNE